MIKNVRVCILNCTTRTLTSIQITKEVIPEILYIGGLLNKNSYNSHSVIGITVRWIESYYARSGTMECWCHYWQLVGVDVVNDKSYRFFC